MIQIPGKSAAARRWIAVCLIFATCGACSVNPQQRLRETCRDCQTLELPPREFAIQAFVRNGARLPQEEFVHLYFEGDGRPWFRGMVPAADPNSRQMTALRLMMLDDRPSVYLNRPCYGLPKIPPGCTADLWTHGRYSPRVVHALNAALDRLQRSLPGKKWVLIGHSGGGSLALLLAQNRREVVGVITLAANLDHRTWTNHFGYLPLVDSLNPVEMPLLPDSILRWHFAAARDQQVPAPLIAAAAAKDPRARFQVVPDSDHTCCWQRIWPHVLEDLADQLTRTK